jgi:hypothetical protein
MASSWNDQELSRAITSRSFAHKKKSGYTAGGCNLQVMQPVDTKADVTTSSYASRALPLGRKGTCALHSFEQESLFCSRGQ